MPFKFAMVCEARADFEIASSLATRVLCGKLSWLDARLGGCSLWLEVRPNQRFLTWQEIPAEARRLDIKAHGKFQGDAGKPDARAARKALLVIERLVEKELGGQCDGVILVRDDDGDEQRREGLEQARRASQWDRPIVLGVAHTKRECWVLAGFQPKDKKEKGLLDDLRLGFDPLEDAQELTATHDHDKRSAKRVLEVLTGGDRERERECWENTDLELLRTRGDATGLREYLREVEERLAPRLGKPP